VPAAVRANTGEKRISLCQIVFVSVLQIRNILVRFEPLPTDPYSAPDPAIFVSACWNSFWRLLTLAGYFSFSVVKGIDQ
jgi:hypothetical protein